MKDGVEAKDGGKLELGSVEQEDAEALQAISSQLDQAVAYHASFEQAARLLHTDFTFLVETLASRSHDQEVSDAIGRARRILAAEDPVSVYG